MNLPRSASRFIDAALDTAVVPGFSRIGYAVRSRLQGFEHLSPTSLADKTIIITGPTSGLGRAAADDIVRAGASVVLVGRSKSKLVVAAGELDRVRPRASTSRIETAVCDMGDLDAVRKVCAEISERFDRIDVLIHNAGALTNERTLSPQGLELTIAVHVLGPHLMTTLLLDKIRQANGRIITVSSGGMYGAPLGSPDDIAAGRWPEMSATSYNGTRQYAIAKRMQVTLNEMWAAAHPDVTFAAMHPGWADTPGVQDSIPTFRTVMRPLLRTVQQGADTISWLAADPACTARSGAFWCDRMVRPIHRLPTTRRSDTAVARTATWAWCQKMAGLSL
jgi:dehydrogenase/reductase SDR family member 12